MMEKARPFLLVKGGYWKTSELMAGETDYGLIHESVSPGFDWDDWKLAKAEELKNEYPNIDEGLFDKYCKPEV